MQDFAAGIGEVIAVRRVELQSLRHLSYFEPDTY